MNRTGVFATKEETKECFDLANEAGRTPMIKLASDQPDFASTAWDRVNKTVYKAALAHGLPEIEGFYGMDADGQFVTA